MRAATGPACRGADRQKISIHAAHAGCDISSSSSLTVISDFNPRSPCGLRPFFFNTFINPLIFQSTQPMRAATANPKSHIFQKGISIHAAHAGCDKAIGAIIEAAFISIHAAHAGCDLLRHRLCSSCHHFNPRSPCGLRRL